MICIDGPDPNRPPPGGQEPLCWPADLDIKMRCPVDAAFKEWHQAPKDQRVIRRLRVSEHERDNLGRFTHFKEELIKKNRTGIVFLDATDTSVPARKLLIIVPSKEVLKRLKMDRQEDGVLLVAIIPGGKSS